MDKNSILLSNDVLISVFRIALICSEDLFSTTQMDCSRICMHAVYSLIIPILLGCLLTVSAQSECIELKQSSVWKVIEITGVDSYSGIVTNEFDTVFFDITYSRLLNFNRIANTTKWILRINGYTIFRKGRTMSTNPIKKIAYIKNYGLNTIVLWTDNQIDVMVFALLIDELNLKKNCY